MATTAKKTATPKPKAETYKNHRAGSRKSEVHKEFDKNGKEKALLFGKKKGLKESSLRSWISTWNREKAAALAARKKSTAKKSAPAKKKVAKKADPAQQAA